MTPTIVQTAFGGVVNLNSGGPVLTFFSFSSPPSAGNSILVMVSGVDITNTLSLTSPSTQNLDAFVSLVGSSTSFPDAYGNTAYVQTQAWLSNFVVGGANSQTIDIGGSESNICGFVYVAYEISGLSINPVDAVASGNGLAFPSGAFNLTPLSAATLAFAFVNPVASEQQGVFMGAGSGWTLDPPAFEIGTLVLGTNQRDLVGCGGQHRVLSSTSPVSCALAQPSAGNGWAGVACALRSTVPPPSTNNSGFLSPHVQIKGVRH